MMLFDDHVYIDDNDFVFYSTLVVVVVVVRVFLTLTMLDRKAMIVPGEACGGPSRGHSSYGEL